jgi:hypothetical protein
MKFNRAIKKEMTMKERNIYINPCTARWDDDEPVKINIKYKKKVVASMQLNGGGPDMDCENHGCMYIGYAGWTIYVDASMIQHDGKLIIDKWKGSDYEMILKRAPTMKK